MESQPKISIVIPVYNRHATIGRTIDSFIEQSYPNWEMFVVDDYSTDNTKELIEAYQKKDKRIYYLLNERTKGAQGARNTGIIHSNATWIILFDSDDYAYPDFLLSLVNNIDDTVDVITTWVRKVYIQNGEYEILKWGGDGNIERQLLRGDTYVGNDNAMIRKDKLEEIGLLSEDCPAWQEFDTHIRLSQKCKFRSIRTVLVDYTWGGADSMSVQSQRNLAGFTYVLLHHYQRWLQLEPEAFKDHWQTIFRRAGVKTKWQMIKIAPFMFMKIPYIYWFALCNWIKRKCKYFYE